MIKLIISAVVYRYLCRTSWTQVKDRSGNDCTLTICALILSLAGFKFSLCVINTWSETSWIFSWWWTLEPSWNGADVSEFLSDMSATQSQHSLSHLQKEKTQTGKHVIRLHTHSVSWMLTTELVMAIIFEERNYNVIKNLWHTTKCSYCTLLLCAFFWHF